MHFIVNYSVFGILIIEYQLNQDLIRYIFSAALQ